MWHRARIALASAAQQSPLEVFTQVQLGVLPPVSQTRYFLLQHFASELQGRSISEARIMAMDSRRIGQLLKQLLYDRYLAIPFRLYTYDMEFTGVPRFTADGPTEEIIEMAFFHPESGETFSTLVKPPTGSKVSIRPEVVKLTGITDAMVKKEGVPFAEAWKKAWAFLNQARGPQEPPNSEILLLSHGGKAADLSMLAHALSTANVRATKPAAPASASGGAPPRTLGARPGTIEALPSFVQFGDTYSILQDLHRKRPVTADRLPPSWSLDELATWMKLPSRGRAHRAEVDAKTTWDVLSHSLERYGDETLTPKQQLVAKFFDDAARKGFHYETLGLATPVRANGAA